MSSAGAAEDWVGGWAGLFGVAWARTLSLFLFFNRDRMRMGDLIAGTWVVMARRARLDRDIAAADAAQAIVRSEEHTSELQSLMRISYAVFCLKKKKHKKHDKNYNNMNHRK